VVGKKEKTGGTRGKTKHTGSKRRYQENEFSWEKVELQTAETLPKKELKNLKMELNQGGERIELSP